MILQDVLVKPAGPDCNMDCGYCFYLEKLGLYPETATHRMSHDVLEVLIRKVMGGATEQVVFSWQGGEPTLMGLDFYRRVVMLQQRFGRGQTVGNGLQTNGLLLDRTWARFLADYRFLVGLSLDGPEHVHDRYRVTAAGRGTWAAVIDAAGVLQDAGVAVNALSVVTDYSAQFPEEIYSHHKELGLDHMQFVPCVETHAENPERAAEFSLTARRYGSFLCRLFDLWLEDFVEGKPTTSVRFFDAILHRYLGQEPPDCTLRRQCGDYLVVEHNGDVFSCDFFVEPKWLLGNVVHDNLQALLNSDRQAAFGCLKSSLPPKCVTCEWLHLCTGGCTKDRIRDPGDHGLNHFCEAYLRFFDHADAGFRRLAEEWRMGETERAEAAVGNRVPFAGPKVGRNEPCPCGSGMKFKKCCGSNRPSTSA